MKKGWKAEKLGEVCDVLSGSGFPKKHQGQQDLEYPFYKVSDMNLPLNGKIMIQENNSIDSDVRGKLGAKSLYAGTVIFPKVGGAILTNKKRIISKPSCVDNNIMGLYPHEGEICGDYLFWWMAHVDIYDWSNKASPPSITQKTVSNTTIPIPPLSEQEEIVEVLDTAFAAIDQAKANIEQNIANAKELFQSKLNQIFSQKGEGWVETTLGDLIKVKHGFAFKSQFFTTEGKHVLLTPGNYHERGGYRDRGSKQKYYVGEIPEGYILKQDDLLLAMTEQAAGLLGSPLLVPEPNRFLHNQRLGLIQHISDQPPSNRYLFHAFNTKSFRDEIHNTGTGVKVRHTSPTKICETTINITFDAEIQEQVVNTLESLKIQTDAIVVEYQTKLASLDELKKSILQKAFAGELT